MSEQDAHFGMTEEKKKALEIQQQEEKQQKFRSNMAMYAARYEEN